MKNPLKQSSPRKIKNYNSWKSGTYPCRSPRSPPPSRRHSSPPYWRPSKQEAANSRGQWQLATPRSIQARVDLHSAADQGGWRRGRAREVKLRWKRGVVEGCLDLWGFFFLLFFRETRCGSERARTDRSWRDRSRLSLVDVDLDTVWLNRVCGCGLSLDRSWNENGCV